MPFKEFVAGTPALASDINTYLMEQSVMTFTNATARDAALPTPNEGTFAYLTASDHYTIYNGSSWVVSDVTWNAWTPTIGNLTQGAGAVLQAFYARIGKTVVAQIYVTMGGAGLSVLGQFQIGLPIDIASTNRSGSIGTCLMRSATTATSHLGSVYALSGTPAQAFLQTIGTAAATATLSSQTTTNPFSWNSNSLNYFSFTIMYQGV
jgi:hypothetical protein